MNTNGSIGMKGPIGKGPSETFTQKLKRIIWNYFWPQSEYLINIIKRIIRKK